MHLYYGQSVLILDSNSGVQSAIVAVSPEGRLRIQSPDSGHGLDWPLQQLRQNGQNGQGRTPAPESQRRETMLALGWRCRPGEGFVLHFGVPKSLDQKYVEVQAAEGYSIKGPEQLTYEVVEKLFSERPVVVSSPDDSLEE